MRIIFASDGGETIAVEVSSDMSLADVKALLEAETGSSADAYIILANGQELTDDSKTLQTLGIKEDDVLLFRPKRGRSSAGGPSSAGSVGGFDEIENTRQQILSNPELLGRIREAFPDLANAAQNDPARFRQLLPQLNQQRSAEQEKMARYERMLMDDPFNEEAQKYIEEELRRQAVHENMEAAIEYNPEAFGRVVMLYVNVEINGHPVKAFVDSGAQATIMSPGCAEACNLTRLIDDRWGGMARGVGTARILGRVHSAQIKVGSLHLACSLDILEGKDVDLLFGLDMLRRHQACIDLRQNALVIQDQIIPFLPEHEIPKHGFHEVQEDSEGKTLAPPNAAAQAGSAAQANSARAAASAAGASSSTSAPAKFPGSGNTLGSAPPAPASQPPSSSSHPEEAINSLIALGVNRKQAIELLDSTGGDAERAASLLFSSYE